MTVEHPMDIETALRLVELTEGATNGSHAVANEAARALASRVRELQRGNDRANGIIRRLVDNLEERVRHEADPGTETFGALWEARHFAVAGASDVLGVADTCPHGSSTDDDCGWCDAEGVERERSAIVLAAEWRTVIHNVHQVGGGRFGWHWRCGVAEFQDNACRFDRRAGSWDAMIAASLEHLESHHGIRMVARGSA